jgi:hypothetical protein
MDEASPFYVPSKPRSRSLDACRFRYDRRTAAIKLEGGYGRAERRTPRGVVTKTTFQFAELGVQWVF